MELSSTELPSLVEVLKEHLPTSCKVIGHLKSTIKVTDSHRILVDQWPGPAVILSIPNTEKVPNYVKGSYTMFATTQSALMEFLARCDAIDWSKPVYFAGLPAKFLSTAKQLAEAKKCVLDMDNSSLCHLLWLQTQELPTVSLPAGYSVCSLEEGDSSMVNETWEFANGLDTLPYIQYFIKNFFSLGIRESSGNLIAHVLVQEYNSPGMIYVHPNHRGQGLARYLLVECSKKILVEQDYVFDFVEVGNSASLAMHQKYGFKYDALDDVYWLTCKPKTCTAKDTGRKCCV